MLPMSPIRDTLRRDLRSRSRDAYLNRVPRTRRRVTFFCFASATAPALLYLLHPCSRKESNQRKGDPLPLESCAATKTILGFRPAGQPMAVQICSGQICHFHRGVPEGPSVALCQRAASCRAPSDSFPAKVPVLGAANGTQSVPLQVPTAQ
jgi:hypothetical protein